MVAIAAASGLFEKTRTAWVGLFSVATLLYISMTNTYLAAESLFDAANVKDRSRTMTVSLPRLVPAGIPAALRASVSLLCAPTTTPHQVMPPLCVCRLAAS